MADAYGFPFRRESRFPHRVTGGNALPILEDQLFEAAAPSGVNGVANGAIAFTGAGAAVVRIQGVAIGAISLTGASQGAVRVYGVASGALGFTGASSGRLIVAANANGALDLAGGSVGATAIHCLATGLFDIAGQSEGYATAGADAIASGVIDFAGVAAASYREWWADLAGATGAWAGAGLAGGNWTQETAPGAWSGIAPATGDWINAGAAAGAWT